MRAFKPASPAKGKYSHRTPLYGALIAASVGAAMLTGAAVPAAASTSETTASKERCKPTAIPGPVKLLSGVPSTKQLRAGVPIRIQYAANMRICVNRPSSFTLYALNPASQVFEIMGVALGDCRIVAKVGAICTFRDLPSAWTDAARNADRVAVAASNSVGEGPRDTAAGAWLADSRIIAQCIVDAGSARADEVKLSLATAISGAITGIIPLPGADLVTAPVIESGIEGLATLVITKDLKSAAKDFLANLAAAPGSIAADELIKSEDKLTKRVGKGLKGFFVAVGGVLVLKEYKDSYDSYFIDEDACADVS